MTSARAMPLWFPFERIQAHSFAFLCLWTAFDERRASTAMKLFTFCLLPIYDQPELRCSHALPPTGGQLPASK